VFARKEIKKEKKMRGKNEKNIVMRRLQVYTNGY
jgi:hypothetical protein